MSFAYGWRRRLRGLAALAAILLVWQGCQNKHSSRQPPPATNKKAPPGFVDITDEVGLRFQHVTGADGHYAMQESMGSGCALFDYDADGDLDIYLVNGQRRTGPKATNRLFRQEQDGTLTDVTSESGTGDTGYGMGVATATWTTTAISTST